MRKREETRTSPVSGLSNQVDGGIFTNTGNVVGGMDLLGGYNKFS